MTLTVDGVEYKGARDFLWSSCWLEGFDDHFDKDRDIDVRSVEWVSSGVYETQPLDPETCGPFSVFWPQLVVTQYLSKDKSWPRWKIDRWLEETS